MNRRNFLGLTSAAPPLLLLPALDAFAIPLKSNAGANELKIMATNWGFNGTFDQFCVAAKKEGYDGIEVWWPGHVKEQEEMFTSIKKHSLDIGFLCGGGQADWKEHLSFFKKATTEAANNKFQRPLYINCHSGRDHFSVEQNQLFIDHTMQLSNETGVLIFHETHRSRMLFAAPITRQFIEKNKQLKLTLDVSHWCTVHQSMLADQPDNVALALDRTEHIHARIGHPHGPQVNDPRAPEWEAIVKQHFEWWDKVVERKRKKGEQVTVLTEFGPPNYMPTLPYTRQAVADQWAINVYMMKLLRKRYQQ